MFMSLKTGQKLTGYKWTELPMPEEVIRRVNFLGKNQPKELSFFDRDGDNQDAEDQDDQEDINEVLEQIAEQEEADNAVRAEGDEVKQLQPVGIEAQQQDGTADVDNEGEHIGEAIDDIEVVHGTKGFRAPSMGTTLFSRRVIGSGG